ncbi:chloride channel protein [Pseudonocardia halophobica]|uniref:Voltage-gated clc-type chloride channel n=1 Tax=Pseudonocardia halophobica TaxID=29401 RepID=A0A9W6L8X2_9PSEU|nr:chloride channel protein [Pseudonocardia halophobica]GLL14060.1 voltage-gated clc-type chloride channel [Pseudonocardia halophobica]
MIPDDRRPTAADGNGSPLPRHLGDFTLDGRVLVSLAWAVPIGALGATAAWALLRLIALITNAVFFQRLSTEMVSPGSAPHPWWLVLSAPVVGGLVIGVMARYGSEKIRGHGMPEAIEAILMRRSRVAPRIAVLKPTSAAISIGTGGPFGAEGPIIMTGGAVGSILAQHLHLSADERKALMVSGAAAGMAATFNAPLASVLLAVELLLFEWRPRSFLPVTCAVAVATVVRAPLLGADPLFPVDLGAARATPVVDLLCVGAGLVGGLLAVAVTALVYFSEDQFARLPVHWMWWPAIGGLIIGVGGLIEPRALGVGYDVIDELLTGHATLSLIVGILLVKSLMWGLSLGSGTSGGVLAPVFMIGAALGAVEGLVFPAVAPGFWAMVGLAAVVGGVMRSPLTGVVFSLELTHAWSVLVPLLIASASAYGLSALLLRRSVLTEKIARRGYHLSREYDVDPLEVLLADEVMAAAPAVLPPDAPLPASRDLLAATVPRRGADGSPRADAPLQRLYPVVDDGGRLHGAVPRQSLVAPGEARAVADVLIADPVVVHADDTLREIASRFARHGITAAPVVDRADPARLVGLVTVDHLLDGRLRDLAEEHDRERPLGPRSWRSRSGRRRDGYATLRT